MFSLVHLKKAKEELGSWTLAAAAYNAGNAGISRRLKEQGVSDYYDLLLGEETEVIDILIQLKKSYRIWLLSNTNPSHIKKEVENNNVFPRLIDGTVYSFDVGYRKPEKDIYKIACKLADVAPKRCVFIDDLEDNIRGANNVGLHGIHYRNTPALISDLKSLKIII